MATDAGITATDGATTPVQPTSGPRPAAPGANGRADSAAIRIRGARANNLQNVDVDLPRNRLIVITGVSGSGKSSLAFDTLLAEGQRQYIDSLSVYARQFFDQRERPDVDRIEGLQPAVAIDQSQGSHSPRSTVGTITEAYDYLRLLYARTGEMACAECGEPISQQAPEEIEQAILALPADSRAMLLAPLVQGRKGKHAELLEEARKAGFVRVRIDGLTYPIEDAPPLGAQKTHDIDAVIDRVVIRDGLEERLSESVRLAVRHGDGVVRVVYQTPEDREKASSDAGGSAYDPEHGWREKLYNTRYACPSCKTGVAEVEPRTFSFNSPYGACPACDGMGVDEGFDPELVLPDLSLSLAQGAIAPWRSSTPAAKKKQDKALAPLLAGKPFDAQTPLEQWPEEALQTLLTGEADALQKGGFLGLLLLLEEAHRGAKSDAARERLDAYRGKVTCPDCNGSRLRPEARSCRVNGMAIHELTSLSIRDAHARLSDLEFDDDRRAVAEPIVREVVRRLKFLQESGVGYLSLGRPADTLSGGELQRVRLATGIGSGLVGVMYLLDEPSIGLHPRDNRRLIDSMRGLQRQGNTVIVVEHDEEVMRAADWLIDIGPGAGDKGGLVVAEGTPDEVAAHPTSVTGRYLRGESILPTPEKRRRTAKSRSLEIEGAELHNLKSLSVTIPLGALVCVSGVSGSGKSSLVMGVLAKALAKKLNGAAAKPGPYSALRGVAQLDRFVKVDQSPIGRSPRSNAATYTGAFDEIRKLFAGAKLSRQRGYKLGRFSFNVKGGRCEECQGQGVQKIEMNFLPDLFVPCDACGGARFNRQTLAVRYKQRSIADVLAMQVDEAVEFFKDVAAIHRPLAALADVGLGYLRIGQPSNKLSGGEAQRIKLAAELGAPKPGSAFYVLDEPTTGLHADDVRRLLGVLHRLVDAGNTVLVIEHHLDVMRSADWLIDLGPEGGDGGGCLVAAGTPEEVAQVDASHTGQWLRKVLG
ncbi:UvrABC system protein A [Pseudobythopirellula maris]|uniref:UvrABC system protein A n=1 Tax=Pseudobythopirellula maris TaxID=2527991 RepID=A0A5C5ZQ08_9BACT|nr:excinuclease ABC subunit UvrA [Pseudobythopirellula maris]TWT88423.1 UvrABC system protein A [Pseudobythopirellula maris]